MTGTTEFTGEQREAFVKEVRMRMHRPLDEELAYWKASLEQGISLDELQLSAANVLPILAELIERRDVAKRGYRGGGFVVVEYNQAGGPAKLEDFGEIHNTRDEAVEWMAELDRRTAESGRRDRHRIATIDIEEDEGE